MNKDLKSKILGGAFFFGLVILALVLSGTLTIINIKGSVTFQGVTYKCQDDVSPLSADLQLAGCRLCAMEELSINPLTTSFEQQIKDNQILKFGLGDCIAKTTSRGRTKYVWDGPTFDTSSYYDVRPVDSEGYISAVTSRFVTWSNDYSYCPTKGLIKDLAVGACTPLVEPDPIITEEDNDDTPIFDNDNNATPGLSGTQSTVLWIVGVITVLTVGVLVINKK